MHRVDTRAELVIAAPRATVWSALMDGSGHDACQHVEGTPTEGVGARAVSLGPPLPPHGIRTVMLHEVTGLSEGLWLVSQTWATAWEHTETTTLRDEPDGATRAVMNGWWSRPGPSTLSYAHMAEPLTAAAQEFLARLSERALVRHASGT